MVDSIRVSVVFMLRMAVQQPHALAWDWKEDGPDLAGIGNPKRWEDMEEPVHSDFAAVPAGTGAMMHQCAPPGSQCGSDRLPADICSEGPLSFELQTLELQHMASLTVSPRKRTLEQCPPSTEGNNTRSRTPESVEDPITVSACDGMPLQSFSSLTISPGRRSLDQAPMGLGTVMQCMHPILEDSSGCMAAAGVPSCIESAQHPVQHVESLTVGPGRPSLGQVRPMSPGRYEDAESSASLGTTWVDHCAVEGERNDDTVAPAMAATNDGGEQEADLEDPLAFTNRKTVSGLPCCGEAGPGEVVWHPFQIHILLAILDNICEQSALRHLGSLNRSV